MKVIHLRKKRTYLPICIPFFKFISLQEYDKDSILYSFFILEKLENITMDIYSPLFRKKRFEINFFVQQNASKFAIFIENMLT